jgi:hypothetical protein
LIVLALILRLPRNRVISLDMNLIQCNAELAANKVDILLLGESDVKGEEILMIIEIVHYITVSFKINVLLSKKARRRGKIEVMNKKVVHLIVLNMGVIDADVLL